MRKLSLVMAIIIVLVLTGCNGGENNTKEKNLSQEVYKNLGAIKDVRIIERTEDGGYLIIAESKQDSVIKINSQGKQEWSKTYGDSYLFNSIKKTSDGHYLLAGTMMEKDEVSDACLLKIDQQGNRVFLKTYPKEGIEFINAVTEIEGQGYLLVGYNMSELCGYLIKTDQSGEKEWDRLLNSDRIRELEAVYELEDGGFIVAGYSTEGSCLIKVNNQGEKEWFELYDGDIFHSIYKVEENKFILSGQRQKYAYLVKIDLKGNELWSKTYRIGKESNFTGLAKTIEGNFILLGYTRASDYDESSGYVVKMDPQGNQKWAKFYGGQGDDRIYLAEEFDNGNLLKKDKGYIFVGSSNSFTTKGYGLYLIRTDEQGKTGDYVLLK